MGHIAEQPSNPSILSHSPSIRLLFTSHSPLLRLQFAPDFGHFQFKTFHHGLKNAPRCLQYVMDEVLENVNQDRIKVYQGQVLVHTSGYTEHLDVLKDVLREFRAYNLKVDVEESVFLTDELIFLGRSQFRNIWF